MSAEDGLGLLEKLRSKIPEKEAKIREKEFEKAADLIRRAEENGGIDAKYSQTFKTKGTNHVRVDIEILGGRAFVTLLLIIFVLIWLLNQQRWIPYYILIFWRTSPAIKLLPIIGK